MIRASRIKLTRAEGRPHECVSVTIEGRPGGICNDCLLRAEMAGAP
ncbi:hypothetical protein LCGC14_3037160 [marine sediment metagenome]|uniref:Uncharacterized protein n=1 Tax=marine sediment metagenome TaxID=412755 RepID=A0A0F8WQE6_9ZZZZ